MRKKTYVILSIIMLVFLVSCSSNNEEEIKEILPDTIITMDILDDYMFRDDVQYVDRGLIGRLRVGLVLQLGLRLDRQRA